MLLQGLSCTTQVHGALFAMITCIKLPYGTSSATNHSLPLEGCCKGPHKICYDPHQTFLRNGLISPQCLQDFFGGS